MTRGRRAARVEDREPERVWDPGLQLERTALSWQRAAISLLGCAVALSAFDKRFLHLQWTLPMALPALFALWMLVAGRQRYERAHHGLTRMDGRYLPDGRLKAGLTLAALLLGLLAVGTWFSQLR